MADTTARPPLHRQAITLTLDILNGRHFLSKLIPPALLLLDTLLCAGVIWKVPCLSPLYQIFKYRYLTNPDTEIDWTAYMEQVTQYVSGERDYTQIRGGTGPLVYPAFHVYIYTALYHLTDKGKDIFLAQQLFAALYIGTLVVVMGCYWQAKVFTLIYRVPMGKENG